MDIGIGILSYAFNPSTRRWISVNSIYSWAFWATGVPVSKIKGKKWKKDRKTIKFLKIAYLALPIPPHDLAPPTHPPLLPVPPCLGFLPRVPVSLCLESHLSPCHNYWPVSSLFNPSEGGRQRDCLGAVMLPHE